MAEKVEVTLDLLIGKAFDQVDSKIIRPLQEINKAVAGLGSTSSQKASKNIEALNASLDRLESSGNNASKALGGVNFNLLGAGFLGLQLNQIFGTFLKGAIAGFNEFTENTTALGDATIRLSAAFKFLQIVLINALEPVLLGLIVALIDLIEFFNGLDPSIQGAIGVVLLLAAAFGILLQQFAFLALGVQSLALLFGIDLAREGIGVLLGRLGLLIGRMLLVALAVLLVKRAWDEDWGGIQGIVEGAVDFITGLLDGFKQFLEDLGIDVGGATGAIFDFALILGGIAGIVIIAQGAIGILSGAFATLSAVIVGGALIPGLKILTVALSGLISVVLTLATIVAGALGVSLGAGVVIVLALAAAIAALVLNIGNVRERLVQFGVDLVKFVLEPFRLLIEIASKIPGVGDSVKGLSNDFNNFFGELDQFKNAIDVKIQAEADQKAAEEAGAENSRAFKSAFEQELRQNPITGVDLSKVIDPEKLVPAGAQEAINQANSGISTLTLTTDGATKQTQAYSGVIVQTVDAQGRLVDTTTSVTDRTNEWVNSLNNANTALGGLTSFDENQLRAFQPSQLQISPQELIDRGAITDSVGEISSLVNQGLNETALGIEQANLPIQTALGNTKLSFSDAETSTTQSTALMRDNALNNFALLNQGLAAQLTILNDTFSAKLTELSVRTQASLNQLVNAAFNGGVSFVNQLIAGLNSRRSALQQAIDSLMQVVRDRLPGSDAKEGPLSDLFASGQALVQTFTEGANSVRDLATGTFDDLLQPPSSTVNVGGVQNNIQVQQAATNTDIDFIADAVSRRLGDRLAQNNFGLGR